ncbi:MAG: YncE family protein [Acidobacteriaceae bacterium]
MPTSAFAQQYAVAGTIPLGGSGAWDYVTADSEGRKLYVSHTSEVNVVDLDSDKPVGMMSGFGYIHGILVVRPTLGLLSDGVKNEIVVFDPSTLKIRQKIATEAEPNSLAYDAGSERLFVGERPIKSLAVISAATMKIEGSIALDGTPRYQAADGKGSIYVILDDRSEMLRIDAKTMQVVSAWPMAPCRGPAGLAYAGATRRLFAPCGNRMMAVVDADSGKVVATPAIGGRPDAAAYDGVRRLAFSSNEDGTLTIVADRGGDVYQVIQNVETEKGARTMALDEKTHAAYISSAQLGPPPAPTAEDPKPTGHLTSLPGTFHVIVVKPAVECDPGAVLPCVAGGAGDGAVRPGG